MSLLPLPITAHPATWRLEPLAEKDPVLLAVSERDEATCRFCGLSSPRWLETYHLQPPGADPHRLAAACPLCVSCQRLGREAINQEFILVWLPEMSQAALNHLVRGVHLVFHAHGEPAHMADPPARDTEALRSAYRTYRTLADRASGAVKRVGTSSPRTLGEALLALGAEASPDAARLTGGLRLLSRGRLFRDGEDRYPDCLDAWAPLIRN